MRTVGTLNMEFTFNPHVKYVRYSWHSWNGSEQKGNEGDFSEAAAKSLCGLDPVKDPNTSWDKGADIPEYNASVKSPKASLTNSPLADTLEESLRIYFQNVAATSFWFVHVEGKLVTIYKMDAIKFEKFLRKFSKLNERGVVRIAGMSTLMLAWLRANT